MWRVVYQLILIFTILTPFNAQHTNDKELSKNSKTSEFKQKLAKTSESLRSSQDESIPDDVEEAISVLGITVPPEYQNDTVIQDHHIYYNSTFYSNPEVSKCFWVDLDKKPNDAIVHRLLSDSHRQATTVRLSFEFPFYGHLLRNVTIATGGFLYTGDYLHNWIAATQYIAPLMANFDTSQSKESVIRYRDNGTAFTVQWEKVYVQNRITEGAFTFQVTLQKSGDIVFAYQNIPFSVSNISDSRHPVKIGISDAYVLERSLFFVRRRTIFEYHRIDMLKRNVTSDSVLYFTALPTCPAYRDCGSCVAANPKLECGWCESVGRCSDGVDRAKQSWITNGCTANKVTVCSAQPHIESNTTTGKLSSKETESTLETKYDVDPILDVAGNIAEGPAHFVQEDMSNISAGAITTILVFVGVLLVALGWVMYAYKFPQSPSGQFLIKYRPTQWTLRSKDELGMASNTRHF